MSFLSGTLSGALVAGGVRNQSSVSWYISYQNQRIQVYYAFATLIGTRYVNGYLHRAKMNAITERNEYIAVQQLSDEFANRFATALRVRADGRTSKG